MIQMVQMIEMIEMKRYYFQSYHLKLVLNRKTTTELEFEFELELEFELEFELHILYFTVRIKLRQSSNQLNLQKFDKSVIENDTIFVHLKL